MASSYQKTKAWRLKHPEKSAEQARKDSAKYKKRYPEKIKKYKEFLKKDRKINPGKYHERDKRYAIKSAYGITLEYLKKLLKEQDYRCAICDKPIMKTRDQNVDHNHETNKIRGILCLKCNFALGLFLDDVEILLNAINYLNKNA